MALSNEETLQDVIRELSETVDSVGLLLKKFPWDNKKFYANWVAQTYYYVRHTTCFIALMAAHWGVHNRERQYQALGFLNGESAHDLLLLSDLENLGVSIEDFKELPSTKVFYQNQYYFIEHISPAAQLGYAFMLEGVASRQGQLVYKSVSVAHGEKAGTFLKLHTEEDVEHFEQGIKLLKGLTNLELEAFRDSLRQSAFLYSQMLEQILKS